MLSLNLAISPLSWWRNWFGVAGVVLARWCGDVPQWCRNILCRSWPCLFCKLGHLKSSTRSNRAPGCCRASNDPLQGRLNPDKSHINLWMRHPFPWSATAQPPCPPHSTSTRAQEVRPQPTHWHCYFPPSAPILKVPRGLAVRCPLFSAAFLTAACLRQTSSWHSGNDISTK